jgi:hypothetical protein
MYPPGTASGRMLTRNGDKNMLYLGVVQIAQVLTLVKNR